MSIKDKLLSILSPNKKEKTKTVRKHIGDIGEDIACEYLCNQGYRIVARNVQISHRELDIVAEDDFTTVIAEVKTLSQTKEYALSHGHRASEQIDREKAENIISAAQIYRQKSYDGKDLRIDVIEVYLGGASPEIVHTENAINRLMLGRRRR